MPGLSREHWHLWVNEPTAESVAKHPYPEILDIQRYPDWHYLSSVSIDGDIPVNHYWDRAQPFVLLCPQFRVQAGTSPAPHTWREQSLQCPDCPTAIPSMACQGSSWTPLQRAVLAVGHYPEKESISPSLALLKQLKPEERKQEPLQGKGPQWLDRSPVSRDLAFPRKKSCRMSEEMWCIIGRGEFLFPVWLPGFLIALEKSVLGKNVISERFHHAPCSGKCSQRRGGLASFSDHFHV